MKRPAMTADIRSCTDDLIGCNLGFFCKEVEVSVCVIDFGLQLTTFQASIREGFDEDTIYALLDILVFQTILKKSNLGTTLLERFNRMYTIPAVTYTYLYHCWCSLLLFHCWLSHHLIDEVHSKIL